MENPSTEQVRSALADTDFPKTKEDLVADVTGRGAPDEVVAAVRALPLAEYASVDEVVRSVEVR